MKRLILGVVVVAVVVAAAQLLFASDAWAHGGQFRGPGDSVPPGLREPSDPTPPPPPPPSGPPPYADPDYTHSDPEPAEPARRPRAARLRPRPLRIPRPRVGAAPRRPRFEDWTFWYHNNNDDIENLKWALYHKLSSDNPLFSSGRDTSGARGAEMRRTQKKVQEIVVDALLWAMDPKNSGHQDTESASYIALAKVARDPVHIPRIMAGLDLEKKRDQIVQESAALALGLLRRAEKEDQFTARELDKVRDYLFTVFENDKYQARVRGFAAIAIGLLGDQPTGSGEYANDVDAAAKATTVRLFELLKSKYSNQDLYVGHHDGHRPPAQHERARKSSARSWPSAPSRAASTRTSRQRPRSRVRRAGPRPHRLRGRHPHARERS